MSELIQGNPWVWVVVQNPGRNEQFLGQYDSEKDISYIPTFLEKEEASQCLKYLKHDETLTYEVQAIQYEQLARNAAEHGFVVFILNRTGEVLEKLET